MSTANSLTACYRFSVNGRVQGVYFRQSSLQQARALGLRGWVRNTEDGRVEGEVVGDAVALDAFCRWLRQGPPAARVDQLIWEPLIAALDFTGFEVRR